MRKRQAVLLFVSALSLLLLPGAASREEILRLSREMGWKAGQTIADVGAGEGEIGFAAAEAVGQTGKVFLTELDEAKRKALEDAVQRRGVMNMSARSQAFQEVNLMTKLIPRPRPSIT